MPAVPETGDIMSRKLQASLVELSQPRRLFQRRPINAKATD